MCHNGVEFGEVRRRKLVCGEDSESRGLALCFRCNAGAAMGSKVGRARGEERGETKL